MLKLFDRTFAQRSFRLCAVFLLVSGMILGQERRAPVLKGGVEQQERRSPVLKGGIREQGESKDDACQVLGDALDLYDKTSKSRNVVLPDEWSESKDKVDALFD